MGTDEVPQYDFRRTRAERAASAVLPVSGIVWTAAEIMHLAGVQGATLKGVTGTALVSALAWGAAGHWRRLPARLPWWTAAAGSWLTIAVGQGPLHWWPYAPLTWTWIAAALITRFKAGRHPLILGAQEWRQQRADWLHRSRDWGLDRSHLLEFEETRLGERYVVSTKGTGRRASQIAGSHTEELIAEHESLPVSRVSVRPHHLAGRVRISLQRTDPWARPIFHPVVDEDPEIDLSGPYSITGPAAIGQDPETGHRLDIPLWDELGGKNISVVAIKGSGKTVVLDNASERVTAASDALLIRVNLSIKGPAEADRWGPACHLTAFGPHQKGRAVKVLAVVGAVLEWRSQRYAKSQYDPSPGDPLFVLIVDEADSAMAVPAVRKQLDDIATKGREFGASVVRAGQRGTTDYGSAKMRSQDDVFLIGAVNRQGEVYHAAGNAGFALPDMASYGGGKPGVWAVALLGGGHNLGRTWILGETRAAQAAAVARIAEERAFAQPELHPACREFLGEAYEVLLSTDVFAKWARDRAPVPSMSNSRTGGNSPAPAGPPVATLDADDITHLDFPPDLPEGERVKLAAIDAKNAATRQLLAETAAMPRPPEVPREALDAHTEARWQQAAEQTQIPDAIRRKLLSLLEGDGMSGRKIAGELGGDIKRADVMWWLHRLRWEGLIESAGKGPGSRWRLVPPSPGGDAS